MKCAAAIFAVMSLPSWGQHLQINPFPAASGHASHSRTNVPQNPATQQAANSIMGYTAPAIPPSDPALLHQFIVGQYNKDKKRQQTEYIRSILAEDLRPMSSSKTAAYYARAKPYYDAFDSISRMAGQKGFSLARAVFLVEDAWHEGQLHYGEYVKKIKEQADWGRLVMRRERLSASSSLHINYAIQKLYTGKIYRYNDKGEAVRSHKPFRYDFADYRGDTNWSQMFVTKLLYDGKGQCHSMPLLYLVLAEELGGEAFLSLAPEHSYIRFRDDAGNWFNFETTNGNLVSEDWLMSTGFVNAAAIKNRIFMDTLGRVELAAQMLVDLALGYRQKFGYDDFLWETVGYILRLSPRNIQAMMMKADMLLLLTKQELRKAGNPPLENISRFPAACQNYASLMSLYDDIDNLGYMAMPEELYRAWLRSLEEEKRKLENQQIENELFKQAGQ